MLTLFFVANFFGDPKINEVVQIFEFLALNSPKEWLNHSDLLVVFPSHITNYGRRLQAKNLSQHIPTHEIMVTWMEPQYRFLHPHKDAEDFIPNLHPK